MGKSGPCLGILRRDLHDILLDNLENIDFRLGTTISHCQQDAGRVSVKFEDGELENFDLVIGADGLHSSVRKMTLGDIPIRRVGDLCCRFVIPRPRNLDDWTLYAGKQKQFLIVPMSETEAYVYAGRQAKATETLAKESFLEPFMDFPDQVSAICAEVNKNDLIWSPLDELQPLERWGNNRIVLIGDAVHAMPPFMAQGASLALEDALVLGDEMSSRDSWHGMSNALTEKRRERVLWALERNRRREKLTNLPYWVSSLGLRLVGQKTWIEDYAPLAKRLELTETK